MLDSFNIDENKIFKDFDRCDCQIYESVARMPPFKRKMLVLIGAIGVGRDSLLKRLIKTVSCFLNVNEHTHTLAY